MNKTTHYKLTDKYPEYVKSHYVFLQGGIGGICCGSNHIMYRLDNYIGNPLLKVGINTVYSKLKRFTYNFDYPENKYIEYSFLHRYKKILLVDYIQTCKGEVYKINNQTKNFKGFFYRRFELGKKIKVYEKNNKRFVKKGNLKIFLNKNIYYYLPSTIEDNKKTIFETTIDEYNMI
tara:strand:+ start:111 stop:638 length:528 start_codon:yes stop_codon:yes gene_type:complete